MDGTRKRADQGADGLEPTVGLHLGVPVEDRVDLADEGIVMSGVDETIERVGEVEPVAPTDGRCPGSGKVSISCADLPRTDVPDCVVARNRATVPVDMISPPAPSSFSMMNCPP